jgi:hypothetical protein
MKTFMILGFAFVTTVAFSALAASQTLLGKVQWLMVDDGTASGPGGSAYTGTVFLLDQTAGNTTCKTEPVGGGKTYIRLPDTTAGDRMRQLVTSAYLSGKNLAATVNDASKDAQGVCIARGVRMQQ